MTRQYSEEELKQTLQDLAAELGKTPSVSDLREADDVPNRSTFRTHFGCWSDALKAAGLEPQQPYSYDRDELLAAIKRAADELDRRPTRNEVLKRAELSEHPFRTAFGSWGNAMEEAGYPANPRIPSEQLIKDLREFANYYSGGPVATPTKRQMNDSGPHSHTVYSSRFGSWTAAVVQAGLNPDSRQISRNKLLNELEKLGDRLNQRPTWRDMEKHGAYSGWPYCREFGSWNNALEAADYDPPSGGRPPTYEITELIAELRRIARKWGRTPTETEFTDHSTMSSTTYQRRFGSWRNAVSQAGLEPRDTTSATANSHHYIPVENDDQSDCLTIHDTEIHVGDGIGDRRSKMVYEVLSIADSTISAWPVGFRGDLRRDFSTDELRTELKPSPTPIPRSATPPRLVVYPSWEAPD
jgi:hypothetical protein